MNMDFKRRTMPVEIDGHKFVLQEPLRLDIINAERLSKDYSPVTGEPFVNKIMFRTSLAVCMIQSWNAPDKSVVKKEDYEKVIKEQASNLFVEKVLSACDKLLEVTEKDVAFLKTATVQA